MENDLGAKIGRLLPSEVLKFCPPTCTNGLLLVFPFDHFPAVLQAKKLCCWVWSTSKDRFAFEDVRTWPWSWWTFHLKGDSIL